MEDILWSQSTESTDREECWVMRRGVMGGGESLYPLASVRVYDYIKNDP